MHIDVCYVFKTLTKLFTTDIKRVNNECLILFQNRRNKWKRQIAAELDAANMAHAAQRMVRVPILYHEHNTPTSNNPDSPANTPAALPGAYHPMYYPGSNPYPSIPTTLRPSLPSMV